MKLKNKVAVVTGSSRGIGKATALLLAKEGAKVVINSRSQKDKGQEVTQEIKNLGSEAIFIRADISKPEDVKHLFKETLKAFDRVDILVNNAGVHHPKDFFELDISDWEKILHTNLIGTFLCSQEAAKIMLKQKKGKIINISSVRGLPHSGRPGNIDYSASKAAVINFTKTLAKRLAPTINVNTVAPGPVKTTMTKWKPKYSQYMYINRLITTDEVAKAVLYLASDDADAIHGEVLVIDGGYSIKS